MVPIDTVNELTTEMAFAAAIAEDPAETTAEAPAEQAPRHVRVTLAASDAKRLFAAHAAATSSRYGLPILQEARLRVDPAGVVALQTTNLSTGHTRTVPAAVTVLEGPAGEPLDVIVARDRLGRMLALTDTGSAVSLEVTAQDVTVALAGGVSTTLAHPFLDLGEWPRVQTVAQTRTEHAADGATIVQMVHLDAEAVPGFLVLLARATRYCATDSARPVFNALLLRTTGERLHLVGADSYRIVDVTVPGAQTVFGITYTATDVLVALPDLQRVLKLVLPGEPLDLVVTRYTIAQSYGADQECIALHWEQPSAQSVTNMVSGTYPNYEAIVPRDEALDTSLVIDAKRLATVLKTVPSDAAALGFVLPEYLTGAWAREPGHPELLTLLPLNDDDVKQTWQMTAEVSGHAVRDLDAEETGTAMVMARKLWLNALHLRDLLPEKVQGTVTLRFTRLVTLPTYQYPQQAPQKTTVDRAVVAWASADDTTFAQESGGAHPVLVILMPFVGV